MGANNRDIYEMFGHRPEVDMHTAQLLAENPKFQADLQKTRDRFLIPEHLSGHSDMYMSYFSDYKYDDLFNTAFVTFLTEENRKAFRKRIVDMLKEYELGMNFFTWVQWFILYREQLPSEIAVNFEIFNQIRRNPTETFRTPKKTQEKKLILSWVRKNLGIPSIGRTPKEHLAFLQKLKKILNKKKPKIRKPRTDHTVDFEIIRRRGKNLPLPGLEFEGPRKNTIENLATALSADASFDDDRRLLWRKQKNHQRLKKQSQKLKN